MLLTNREILTQLLPQLTTALTSLQLQIPTHNLDPETISRRTIHQLYTGGKEVSAWLTMTTMTTTITTSAAATTTTTTTTATTVLLLFHQNEEW